MHQVFNTLRQNDLESKYHPDELRFISMHNSVITCTNTDKQSDLSFRLKLLTQRLPVNDNLYSMGITNRNFSITIQQHGSTQNLPSNIQRNPDLVSSSTLSVPTSIPNSGN
ncbi:hypothetical protein ROZALSC1DRAFT_25954 [Rozella allomycis CSF55]|uniref:Uncharacterized protein n=1 Tax=Rozella allomycis (strain CSF55) TaxID=988480 RepID=A0A4P9Y9X0_ROZAC|nr:hypothetical protein ROZALSC1DRAFT_25954 [Rozella allomycis CSF55]